MIRLICVVNVGKYTIHGFYGFCGTRWNSDSEINYPIQLVWCGIYFTNRIWWYRLLSYNVRLVWCSNKKHINIIVSCHMGSGCFAIQTAKECDIFFASSRRSGMMNLPTNEMLASRSKASFKPHPIDGWVATMGLARLGSERNGICKKNRHAWNLH